MARRDSRGSSIAGIGQLRRRLAWPAASGKLRPPLPSLSLQQPRRSGRDRMSVIGHSEGTVGRRARFGWAGANAGVVDELRTSWQVGCRAVLRRALAGPPRQLRARCRSTSRRGHLPPTWSPPRGGNCAFLLRFVHVPPVFLLGHRASLGAAPSVRGGWAVGDRRARRSGQAKPGLAKRRTGASTGSPGR